MVMFGRSRLKTGPGPDCTCRAVVPFRVCASAALNLHSKAIAPTRVSRRVIMVLIILVGNLIQFGRLLLRFWFRDLCESFAHLAEQRLPCKWLREQNDVGIE